MKTITITLFAFTILCSTYGADKYGFELYYPVYPSRPVQQDKDERLAAARKQIAEVQAKKLSNDVQAPDSAAATIFLQAYKKVQQSQPLKKDDPEKASYLIAEALSDLIGLKKQFPDWQPQIVDYRISKVQSALE